MLLSRQSRLKGHIIALDIKRSEDQDILRGDLYSQLCVSAWNGNIQGTGGGPNCRTWSILRWFPKPGFPKPVRGRREPDCWGFSVLEASEAQDTDNDSLLLLRQLLLCAAPMSHFQNEIQGPRTPLVLLGTPRGSQAVLDQSQCQSMLHHMADPSRSGMVQGDGPHLDTL